MPSTASRKKALAVKPRWISPLPSVAGLIDTGWSVCDWIEDHCVYGEGDWYGEKVKLRPWQRDIIRRLYLTDAKGNRIYRRALIGMGKGNGKTPLAAWIGAYELLGTEKRSPHVIIGAASLKQANLVFGDLKTTVKQGDMAPFVEPYDLRIELKDPLTGVAERIAAEAGTNDGARATAFIADELHEWIGATARVYHVIGGAVTKRSGAFTLAITTAGWDQTSLLYDLYSHGVKVAKGIELDPTFLFVWYEPHDEEIDFEDPEAYEKALREANPAYGDFNDPSSLRHRFATMPAFEFRRYHANQWTSGQVRWLPEGAWDACKGVVDIQPGDLCVLGIDGAAKRDTTAVVGVFPKDEKLYVRAWIFEPPGEGEVIDPAIVEAKVKEICQTYNVVSAPFDPALFFRSAQLLLEEGYPMMEFPQSHGRMVPASQMLYDVVIEQRLVHDGDPTLREHADNAVARETGRGWRLDKDKASLHIDGMVALAMAVNEAIENIQGPPLAAWA